MAGCYSVHGRFEAPIMPYCNGGAQMSAISSAPVGQIFLTAECSQMPFIGFGDDAALAANNAVIQCPEPDCRNRPLVHPGCAMHE